MNKFPLIAILIFLACVMAVSADPGFNIIEDSVNLTSSAGQTLNSNFRVSNTGTTDLNINFSGYTLTSGANQLSISNLNNITNLANGSVHTAAFSVVIPSQQRPGRYTGTLTAASNASNTDTTTINVDVAPTYSVSTSPAILDLGSASLNSTRTEIFNITNTGNNNITNVLFDFSGSNFNLKANKTSFTLPFNGKETIQFNITIPHDSPTGNVTLGSVKLISTELNTTLFSIKANVGGGLEIEGLDVFLSTRKDKSGSDLDVYDGKKLNFDEESVGPASELKFNFNIRNSFTDKDDIDINDITAKVTIEGIDDGKDIEEESEEFDLESEGSEDVDVIVEIPLSVEEGLYYVIAYVEGEDEKGNQHTAQINLKLDINKESRDVIISEASFFPEKLKCAGSSTLTATIKNLGKKIENDAMIEIINSDLGINFLKGNIELQENPFDSDNEFTKSIMINVGKNTTAGTYPITIKSYLQEGILWETKTANFVVEPCEQVEEKPEAEAAEETNETEAPAETLETGKGPEEETTESEEVPVLEPTTTTEIPLTKKPLFWITIIILNIAVIAAIAFLVVKAVGKK